jgi:hypothetical protein
LPSTTLCSQEVSILESRRARQLGTLAEHARLPVQPA